MTVYMPPIDRKKKVQDRYNPDSFRVISAHAEETHPKYEPQPYGRSFQPETPQEPLFPDIRCGRTRVLPHPTADDRHNVPHSQHVNFLRTNVRLLNEPVCTVYSKATRSAHHQWWPSRANEGTLKKPEFACDTIYRNDFMYTRELAPKPSFRHSANPHTTPPTGIVPVNFMREKDGNQRFYKEGISYEHQYNSRADPNYPIRGKRHGALVWDRMDQQDTRRFLDYHSQLDKEEMNTTSHLPSPTLPSPRQLKPASAHPTVVTKPNPPSPTRIDNALPAGDTVPDSPSDHCSPPVAEEE